MQRLSMAVGPRRLCVLAYHGVPDGCRFAAQLDWLAANRQPISLGQARSAILHDSALPPRAVLLTFDDGDRSLVEVGLPLLRERGIPGVAFVVAGLVDTEQPFWWMEVEELSLAGASSEPLADLVRRLKSVSDVERRHTIERMRAFVGKTGRTAQLTSEELRQLESDGVAVGNHSLTHPCLDKCDDAVLKVEVHRAHERLTQILGHPPGAFAYPNGNWDARVRETVAAAGYDLSFAFDHRIAALPVHDPLTVSRVRVDTAASLDRFRIRVSGLHPLLHHVRGRS